MQCTALHCNGGCRRRVTPRNSAQGRAIARPFIATGSCTVATPGRGAPRPCNCTALHCNIRTGSAVDLLVLPKAVQLHGPSLQRRRDGRVEQCDRPQGRAIARPFIATVWANSPPPGTTMTPRPCNCTALHCNTCIVSSQAGISASPRPCNCTALHCNWLLTVGEHVVYSGPRPCNCPTLHCNVVDLRGFWLSVSLPKAGQLPVPSLQLHAVSLLRVAGSPSACFVWREEGVL